MTISDIPAVLKNVIRLRRDAVEPSLMTDLRARLTRENPAYHQMKRMKDRNPRKYQYTKLPPATISSMEEDAGSVYVPRGFKNELVQMANDNGQSITFYDETLSFPMLPMQMSDGLTLTHYQKRGVGQMVMGKSGILVAPCGGGKTVTGLSIMVALRQPTLILVHTHDLLSQWRRELADKAVLPGPIGQWADGVKQRENVTVATVQSLTRAPVPDLVEFLSHFGCVILDEAHHCPADTFLAVMNLCAARYRFGLTATPKRKDGLEFLMFDTIGPIVSEITDTDLQDAGRSQSCEVHEILTTFYSRHTADEWNSLLAAMTTDQDRNRLIVETVVAGWHAEEFPLILSQRVGHCRELQSMLEAHGMNVELLVGTVAKPQRERIVERAKAGLIDAIVATKVADEGLDIPNLSSVHLTTPSANESKIQQQTGRIRRPVEGKVSKVYDYVDNRVSAMVRMAQARRRFYKRWGFTKADTRSRAQRP